MKDWNIVITVEEHGYREMLDRLSSFGLVDKTDFYNVLVMSAEDARDAFIRIQAMWHEDRRMQALLSRVMPVTHSFSFQTPEQFEDRARQAASALIPALGGRTFHVRMHRRGFKGRLSSQNEELFLDHFLMHQLDEAGTPGQIGFDNPDCIIALESVGQWAGLSLWTRDEIRQFPLLKLD
jgi:tRNA(Ser,Leu) C12 N-acetylase TAN1